MAYGDGASDKLLGEAWHRFCDNLKSAGDQVFKDSNPTGDLMRMDGFRFLTQNLGQAFPLALETADPAYPMIHYFTHPLMKLGGDVSDFTYRQVWISGEHTYRITGMRGTARWFNVTVQGPKPDKIPGTDFAPLHEPFGDIPEANILGHQIKADADGNFELYIGGEERSENWLPTTPGSRKLFIREAYDAWDETPTTLSIERVGMDSPRPMPSPARMAEAFDWAGRFVTGFMNDWPEHSWATSGGVVDPDNPNEFPADKSANTADDAKRGRMAANLIWSLKPDEALIVEMDNHDGFWLFGMNAFFVESMDYLYRSTSFAPARTMVDSDDVVRFVIAHDDPGVHNWLDKADNRTGIVQMRVKSGPQVPDPMTKVVPISVVRDHLPADTPTVSAEERAEALRQRAEATQMRIWW